MVEIVGSCRVSDIAIRTARISTNPHPLPGPDAEVVKGSRRKYTDNEAVAHMKRMLGAGKECQASLINYRKGGTPFINLVTIVPIPWDSDEIVYHVGFQVDLVEQPNAILRNMRDGSYQVNYTVVNNPQPSLKTASSKALIEPPSVKTIGLKQELLDLIGPVRANAAAAIGGEEAGKTEWLKYVLEETDGELILYTVPSVLDSPVFPFQTLCMCCLSKDSSITYRLVSLVFWNTSQRIYSTNIFRISVTRLTLCR